MAEELVQIILKNSGKTDMTKDTRRRKVTIPYHRSAVGVTSDGRKVQIHDNSWALIRSWKRLLPTFVHEKGRFIQNFPRHDAVVYALVDDSPGKHGRSTEAIMWCTAEQYEKGFKKVAAQHHVGPQDKLFKAVARLIDVNASHAPHKHRPDVMELASMVKDATFFVALVEHYIIGRPASEVVEFHT